MNKLMKLSVIFLSITCTFLGLTSCQVKGNVVGLSDYRYENEEKYLVGEANLTQPVKNIEIDWLSGNVNIVPHQLNTVSLSEESEVELPSDKLLRYWLDDTTLRIHFCSCGKFDLSALKKDLTVLVPEKLVFNNLKVNSLSSNVNLTGCAVTKLAKINTISGIIEANFSCPLNEFKGSSTSGSFKVDAPFVSSFDINTVSGQSTLSVQKEPDELDIDATSGNINLTLPENASFMLEYDHTSGKLYSELTYRQSLGKYIFGEGANDYKISTVSSDVYISKYL